MMNALLFPHSTYLAKQWWHRLAKVVFWVWFVFVLGYGWSEVFVKPFNSCHDTKVRLEFILKQPSELDCGTNAASYFIRPMKTWSPSEIGLGAALAITILYLALITPSLLYRLALYIGKGSSWRGAANASDA